MVSNNRGERVEKVREVICEILTEQFGKAKWGTCTVGSIRWRGVLQKYIFRHAVPGNNNYNVLEASAGKIIEE